MHEHAKGLPFPLLDTELVLSLHRLGYTRMKVQGNKATTGHGRVSGAFSGGMMPDGVVDVVTRNASWLRVSDVLSRGLGDPRAHRGDWWDFHMKLVDAGG